MARDARAQSPIGDKEPIEEFLARVLRAHGREDFRIHYRKGTSDERVLREVLGTSPYRRRKIQFDVERGERWLDLGANIGAFGIYAHLRGATVNCYEPDPECFKLLEKNVAQMTDASTAVKAAVSHLEDGPVQFWTSKTETDHHRGTILEKKSAVEQAPVWNINMRMLMEFRTKWIGIKMDIEGAEHGLLDRGLLPDCQKLALEYHLWRDPSMANLRRRLYFLQTRFRVVSYPPEFDRMLASGYETNTSYYDRLIFCKEPR
jgi:FkbM family methyltransferase